MRPSTFEEWKELYCEYKFNAWEVYIELASYRRREVKEIMEFAKSKNSYLKIGCGEIDLDGNRKVMYSQADVYRIEHLLRHGDGG